jgi:hypothetical protein
MRFSWKRYAAGGSGGSALLAAPQCGTLGLMYQPPQVRVVPLLLTTVRIMARNLVPFLVIGLLSALPIALGKGRETRPEAWLLLALALVLYALGQAVVGYATVRTLRGEPAGMAASIARGVARLLPATIACGAAILIIMLGVVVFVIPGIIAAIVLIVTVPACVIEGLGPVASLRRSAELTAGFRWQIFGAAFAASLVAIGVEAIISGTLQEPSTAHEIVSAVWNGLSTGYAAVFAGTVYHELRVAKDDPDLAGADAAG